MPRDHTPARQGLGDYSARRLLGPGVGSVLHRDGGEELRRGWGGEAREVGVVTDVRRQRERDTVERQREREKRERAVHEAREEIEKSPKGRKSRNGDDDD